MGMAPEDQLDEGLSMTALRLPRHRCSSATSLRVRSPQASRPPYRPTPPRQGYTLRAALRSVALRPAPALTRPRRLGGGRGSSSVGLIAPAGRPALGIACTCGELD